ncbi:Monodehydroascorbate reductase, chloroplastic/mitochondrial [Glycine soja]
MSMDGSHDQEVEDLELFQKHVGDRFSELLSSTNTSSGDALLSIAWLRRILDEFLCCEAEFKAVVLMGRDPSQIAKPPLDKVLPELLDRVVKSLDVCNAVTLGLDAVKNLQRLAEIAVAALDQTPLGDGQVRRAKKALSALVAAMLHDDSNAAAKGTERTRSFGRRAGNNTNSGKYKSLSWSMAKNWSAAKQIHAMISNLAAPRGAESSGLAQPIYMMSSVLVLVMWTLVAAVPCQERNGLGTHFPLPRQLGWAQPMIGLQEKIAEEWKKKEKKGNVGLLEEMQRMDKLGQSLVEFADSFQFPAEAERLDEVKKHVEELGDICKKMDEGLEPLQQQIREVFHRLVRSRTEFLLVRDAARTFVEHGMADGRLCIVTKEPYAPYERPALTRAYLFPPDKKPARLPGFHTCVGSGGERQTPEWYKENVIEMLYEDPVKDIDIEKHTLTTSSGKLLKYGSLIIATGCTASRFPEKIGGNLPGVHYIRHVADADALILSLEKAKKVVVVGGGYIGMEVAAAAVGWKLDATIIFPEDDLLQRLFTPSLARRYEELYQKNGVKVLKVIIGIGARPAVSPFERVGQNTDVGGIQVDGQFRTSTPGIFAVGDVAAFPLKIYNRISRVEHVDHARRSAQHCVKALLSMTIFHTSIQGFLNMKEALEKCGGIGETVEIGNFDPKIATFWIESGKLKGVLLESGSPEEFQLLPKLARSQPLIDKAKLQNATSVEEALEIARGSLQGEAVV